MGLHLIFTERADNLKYIHLGRLADSLKVTAAYWFIGHHVLRLYCLGLQELYYIHTNHVQLGKLKVQHLIADAKHHGSKPCVMVVSPVWSPRAAPVTHILFNNWNTLSDWARWRSWHYLSLLYTNQKSSMNDGKDLGEEARFPLIQRQTACRVRIKRSFCSVAEFDKLNFKLKSWGLKDSIRTKQFFQTTKGHNLRL